MTVFSFVFGRILTGEEIERSDVLFVRRLWRKNKRKR
jgi:hypothetical protein